MVLRIGFLRTVKPEEPKKKAPHPKKEKRTHGSVFRIVEAHQQKLKDERSAGKGAQRY